jgi:translation initiation factor IF-3
VGPGNRAGGYGGWTGQLGPILPAFWACSVDLPGSYNQYFRVGPGHPCAHPHRSQCPRGDSAIERKQQRINEQIRITPIRVISEEGEQLGIIPTDEALERAKSVGLDLVEVASTEKPPVCRIMDYGKFKYQQKKRQHKGHTHHSKNKEIRLRPKIGDADFMTKVNRAKKFLGQKDKVIFSVIFRGRENAHVDEGFKLIEKLTAELEPVSKLEQRPTMHGRRIVAIYAPK